jgi:D-aminoacyl-tRNA deacylase
MRAVVQRVSSASVEISSKEYYSKIKNGLVILLGIKVGDNEKDVNFVADKCCRLRIFEDSDNNLNRSIQDVTGEVLIISQFTLYGDTSKGNRPSFIDAAKPADAIPIYEEFIKRMKVNLGEDKIKTGIFGTMMDVHLVNSGPVTVIVESK